MPFARLDVQRLDLRRLQELPQLRRDELRAVVASEVPRHATRPDRLRQEIAHPLARHRTLHLEQQALPRELVHQRQPTKRSVAVIAVLHEVPAPHVVRTRRTPTIDPVRRNAKTPLSPLFPRHTKTLPAAQAVHPLVIHTPSVQTKAPAHHPVAVTRISPHDLLDPPDERRLVGRDANHVPLRRTMPLAAEGGREPRAGAPRMLAASDLFGAGPACGFPR